MAHTLPVKRETLHNTHVLAGIIFLFVPLILTALISWALVARLGIEHVNGTDILAWLFISLLINLLLFMTSVASGMVTGMTTIQGALSYIFLLLPSGLSLLLLHNMSRYIFGFPYDFYFGKIDKLSPLIRLTEISINPIPHGEIVVYLLSSFALFFLGRYLYQRRHIETAGNAITFDVLRPIFKYSVTFCFMLLLGSYFYSDQGSLGWTYFGYFLGSLLAYFLMEILLNKSLQVFQWRRIKGYGIYALAMIGLIGLFHYDFTGYEKRLPELSEVKSIYMDNFFYALNYVQATNAQAYGGSEYDSPVKAIFTERDNMAAIYSLHQKIVANRLDKKETFLSKRTRDSERICLAYELENGCHIYRQYEISAPEYADKLKLIYESLEYKELHNRILSINLADVDLIEINTFDTNKNVRIVDPEFIAQAVAALQSDIYEETYEEMKNMDLRPPWAHISILLKNNRTVHLDWKKSYLNFEQWLKESEKYYQARLLPGEDIASAIVDKDPDLNKQDLDNKKAEPVIINQETILELEKKPGILKITETEKLELCLRHYISNSEQAAYKVVFQLNNGSYISGFFSEADAPAFVKEHFAPAKEPL